MNRHRLSIIALVLLAVFVLCATAEACPGCAEAQAGQGAERGNIVRGYYYSILFMLAVPMIIFGSFGTYAYRHFRRLRLAAEAEAAAKSQTNELPQASDAGVLTGA